MKKPRLFYYEESENWWVPIEPHHLAGLIDIANFDNDEEVEFRFKRVDMTDEEFEAIPEG